MLSLESRNEDTAIAVIARPQRLPQTGENDKQSSPLIPLLWRGRGGKGQGDVLLFVIGSLRSNPEASNQTWIASSFLLAMTIYVYLYFMLDMTLKIIMCFEKRIMIIITNHKIHGSDLLKNTAVAVILVCDALLFQVV